jgi:hypothetical protein
MKQTTHDILLVIGVLMLAIILLGGPLMMLWNWTMPAIFGLPEITFLQACGLQLLATILFKSPKINKD